MSLPPLPPLSSFDAPTNSTGTRAGPTVNPADVGSPFADDNFPGGAPVGAPNTETRGLAANAHGSAFCAPAFVNVHADRPDAHETRGGIQQIFPIDYQRRNRSSTDVFPGGSMTTPAAGLVPSFSAEAGLSLASTLPVDVHPQTRSDPAATYDSQTEARARAGLPPLELLQLTPELEVPPLPELGAREWWEL